MTIPPLPQPLPLPLPQPLPGLGRRIRRLRVVRRVKQEVLAAVAGVTQTTVSRWESGVLEPSPAVADRLLNFLQGGAAGDDRALRRLVEGSALPVHLITDADHRLLAASPLREREWRRSAGELRGSSLWPFAADDIAAAEGGLGEAGWWESAAPAPVDVPTTGADRGLRILPNHMVWERLCLADGTPVRLCTSYGLELPPS